MLVIIGTEQDDGDLVAIAVLVPQFGEQHPLLRLDVDLGAEEFLLHLRDLLKARRACNQRILIVAPHELGRAVESPLRTGIVGFLTQRQLHGDLMVGCTVDLLEHVAQRLGDARVDLDELKIIVRLVPDELQVKRGIVQSDA